MAPQDLDELFAKALELPDFRRALVQVSQEKATRPVRPCRCVVIEIPESARADEFANITPGAVTAFVAREGEPLLGKIIQTIETGDSKEFSSAADQIREMREELSRKIGGAGTARKTQPQAFASFAEISYAHKSLVSHIYIDELLRVQVHAFPYNGGYLDKSRFSMIEYYLASVETPLTCVVLIRHPKLGEIEREALRLVPSGSSANNIAVAPVAPLTPALMEFIVYTAEITLQWLYNEAVNLFVQLIHGATAMGAIPDAVLKSEDFQKKLKSLPPELTAVELLRLRTDILLQKPSK